MLCIQCSLCSRLCQVLVTDVKVLPVLLKNLIDPEYLFSDQICTILSNLTRHDKTCKTVFKVGPSSRSGKFYLGWKEVLAGWHLDILVVPCSLCGIMRDEEVFLSSFRSSRRTLVWLSWWRSSALKVTTRRLSCTIWDLCCPTWHSCLMPETTCWTRTGDWCTLQEKSWWSDRGGGTVLFCFFKLFKTDLLSVTFFATISQMCTGGKVGRALRLQIPFIMFPTSCTVLYCQREVRDLRVELNLGLIRMH